MIFSLKTKKFEQGDIIAFYYNNKILVKRVIAGPGEWVDIGEDIPRIQKLSSKNAKAI
ncbi:MAG: hypothetical protein IJ965_05350 [Campylobacter sp.]|nr:hypothetical protein [Campylobacter sp.]